MPAIVPIKVSSVVGAGQVDFQQLQSGDYLAPAFGGTGITSYATGDLIYASSTSTLARLPIGSTNQVLTVSSTGVPTWTNPQTVATSNNTITATNNTGSTINAGTICSFYNGNLTVATPSGGQSIFYPVGITLSSIPNASSGSLFIGPGLTNLSTTFTVGSLLYLGSNGTVVNIPPLTGWVVQLGFVYSSTQIFFNPIVIGQVF